MNIQTAREERRSFYVGESKEYGTFSIASAEARREREISSPLVLRWKETDTGYKANARCCVHGPKDPDIHEIERSCPTPELAVHQHYSADSERRLRQN